MYIVWGCIKDHDHGVFKSYQYIGYCYISVLIGSSVLNELFNCIAVGSFKVGRLYRTDKSYVQHTVLYRAIYNCIVRLCVSHVLSYL